MSLRQSSIECSWKVKSTVKRSDSSSAAIEVFCSSGDQAGALWEFNSSSNRGALSFRHSSVGGLELRVFPRLHAGLSRARDPLRPGRRTARRDKPGEN